VNYFCCLFKDVIDTEFTALNVTKVIEFCVGNWMENFTSWSALR